METIGDVRAAIEPGRNPLVLTERCDHLDELRGALGDVSCDLIVLRGGLGAADRREAESRLKASGGRPRIILATGRYLGEGFDEAKLDTLFLALPIAWRGRWRSMSGDYIARARRSAR